MQIPRAIMDVQLQKNTLSFISKRQEFAGTDGIKEVIHHYHGDINNDEIKFSLQIESGYSAHLPIEFIAKKQIAPPIK